MGESIKKKASETVEEIVSAKPPFFLGKPRQAIAKLAGLGGTAAKTALVAAKTVVAAAKTVSAAAGKTMLTAARKCLRTYRMAPPVNLSLFNKKNN